ncbi:hypothetical protein [Actinomycetospora cinnamomea]|uniref:Htaa protein n=1 Tax=Actinomycetospora cinnamomea TaxID=663609 RepID=A0A2U1FDA6_9PSEU|nr:hypothetical protein [Actinomycetospora cinnamomea]PVZ10139.1 hypothetical protein C8D89_105215 [Actinomycetospora cinnamomea]
MRTSRKIAGLVVSGVAALALSGFTTGVAIAAEPVAEIPDLTGRSSSVALDEGFTGALESLEVTPGTIGGASLEDGSVSFPITGGNVTVYEPGTVNPYVQGRIEHDGSGLSLTKGDTRVELTDFVIDPGNPATLSGTVTANGETVADSAVLFDLDGSTLEPIQTDAAAGTATLTGTTVRLSGAAADALNQAFSTDAVQGGLTVGVATIVVDLPGQVSAMPEGGVDTGGGSTAGGVDLVLVSGGALALTAAGGLALAARRRAAGTRS